MNQNRKNSAFEDRDKTNFPPTGFDARPEEEDEPLAIHVGISMPVWKTPERSAAQSATRSGVGNPDLHTLEPGLLDFEDAALSEPYENMGDFQAKIISEKPAKPSQWKRFVEFVGKYAPVLSDESSVWKMNLLVGGALLFVAVLIAVIVLFFRPSS